MLNESSSNQKGEKKMKKLLSLAALIAIMALSASSFAAPTTNKSFAISGTFGTSPTIQVFDNAAGDNEYDSGASLTLSTSGITFPSAQVWPNVDAYSVLKLFVKVSPAGSGWTIVMYETNPWDLEIADLYHSGDRTKTIPWKFGSAAKGDSTPAIGATTQAIWDASKWMACLSSGETIAGLVTGAEGIIIEDGDDVSGLIDITLIAALHTSVTTGGTYLNNVNLTVYVP
ncbi:MAG: hypothetical protein C4541_09685 [Candidatus Auribacter fodinae]|jgi:hypothetical protein|uniref:Uncharacterized protein n=1 Tax=Candidatus Auribacter fodinae TaxID=2093366 RepID=A0A3A4QY80_9BACT|nr:MAG: hypothetical protein C4541_09685 [Candidatus Auribacter fodinae]